MLAAIGRTIAHKIGQRRKRPTGHHIKLAQITAGLLIFNAHLNWLGIGHFHIGCNLAQEADFFAVRIQQHTLTLWLAQRNHHTR